MTSPHPAFARRLFVGSEIYRRPAYGTNHPLAIPRVETVEDLCETLGWFPPDAYRESPVASAEQLAWFHDPDYIEALRAADAAGKASAEMREKYGLGTIENPIFAGVFARASTSVGGSIEAARLVAEKPGVAFHPAGGTHHAAAGRARGFCFFNDPVFAVLALKRAGIGRVLYVDLDAHHGDGVEEAFADDDTVMTVSIHEFGRWPYSGAEDLPGSTVRNFAVPGGFNDSELAFLMDEVVLPLGRDFAPGAVVVTCGADGLKGDPLSKMALSNGALWRAAEAAAALAGRAVIVGGGGYNPWTVARGWAGLWGWLNRFDVAAPLPQEAQAILRRLDCDLVDEEDVAEFWFETMIDPPNQGPVREAVRAYAAPASPRRMAV
jgi:acetoin utilization protein AcuC